MSAATNIGFMSKLSNKADHKYCHSTAKEVFGGDMLDVVLPRLDGFERCGESLTLLFQLTRQRMLVVLMH